MYHRRIEGDFMTPIRLTESFYHRDCLVVAPELVGKLLVRQLPDGTLLWERIAETEAYRGQEDLACHASKGRTPRTELLYRESGVIYVYLCYGIHWLMNVITGEKEQPQGVLLRAGAVHSGPAKLTKFLQIDGTFNGGSFVTSPVLWIADDGYRPPLRTDVRVGIDYAGERWKNIPWRWIDATEK
ncbi:DNA-3-methyladenine glycosylase [uncultured Ruminococcus sp.]|uniref:DNA-3-methyladenine glycosylase n=1 Tax=uncultured Ruminococcus sp. TaxID=165186 RepID=UPI00266D0F22|nr:DNA-3-methyladenine glycosylase [uncultured Ruminococcus sp.]